MGESQPTVFQPDFNHSINVEGSSDRLTSNGGALLLRKRITVSGSWSRSVRYCKILEIKNGSVTRWSS